ncbi:hypothetical protein C5615_19970 [Burkholderia cepacia]|uniref:MoaF-like domain-containing protein n=2 Tax=Burkholderia cepacia TaxID=292 RepID=A0A2S8IP97_BURCE|nr:hypothetical protein C5615_19970 [Burkholderia cepacia]
MKSRFSLLKYVTWPTLAVLLVGCGGASTDIGSDTLAANARATQIFPAVDQVWRADFGDFVFDLNFETSSAVALSAVKGPSAGQTETVSYTATPLREGLFAVQWRDGGGAVVHVEDFQREFVNAFITPPAGQAFALQGPFTLCSVRGAPVAGCGAGKLPGGRVPSDGPVPAAAEFPAVGQVWRADFGGFAFDLAFETAQTLSFSEVTGLSRGPAQSATYAVTPLRQGLFAVRWSDSGGSVVQFEDFSNGTVKSFITQSDGQTVLLQGSLTRVQ